ERIDGPIVSGINIHNLAVRYDDQEILRIGNVSTTYSIVDIIRGNLGLLTLQVDALTGRLRTEADGKWNLLEALASRNPAPPPQKPSTMQLKIGKLTVNGADIEATQNGQ